MGILQHILSYVSVRNAKLEYVETTATHYIYQLNGYKLPKDIVDKNMKKVVKERTAIIQLDINQQNIGKYDYSVKNFGNSVRFEIPKINLPYEIDSQDTLQVTGTFSK
jgi:putative transposon-encoded protein